MSLKVKTISSCCVQEQGKERQKTPIMLNWRRAIKRSHSNVNHTDSYERDKKTKGVRDQE